MNAEMKSEQCGTTQRGGIWKAAIILFTCGLVITCFAQGTWSSYICMFVGSAQRDAAQFLDTCKGNPQASCNPETDWYCLVYEAADGDYCWHSSPSDSCSWWFQLEVNGFEGYHANQYDSFGCNWGPGNNEHPVPEGECFCLYDITKPMTLYLYRCNT